MRADVLADALDAVADECDRYVPSAGDLDSDNSVALHAAALRASQETVRLACRIERARARRSWLRRLVGRPPGQRR
ncbi:MAG: hypothetical protein ACREKH_21285 [Candidatus Rokuibacteriota bacterium]